MPPEGMWKCGARLQVKRVTQSELHEALRIFRQYLVRHEVEQILAKAGF